MGKREEKFDEKAVEKYALRKYGNKMILWWFIEGARWQFNRSRRLAKPKTGQE